jgi:hypothetical protein
MGSSSKSQLLLQQLFIMPQCLNVHSIPVECISRSFRHLHLHSGNYRCSLAGCDLNRRWSAGLLDKKLYPTIHYTKQLIRRCKRLRVLALAVDIHGHSLKQGAFFYGCVPERRLLRPNSPHLRSTGPSIGMNTVGMNTSISTNVSACPSANVSLHGTAIGTPASAANKGGMYSDLSSSVDGETDETAIDKEGKIDKSQTANNMKDAADKERGHLLKSKSSRLNLLGSPEGKICVRTSLRVYAL